ncbi:MAG: 5-formyltetrahydrofolate cyclo-ligase [Aquirufa sp.]
MNKSRIRPLALARRKNWSERLFNLLNESLQMEFMDFVTLFNKPRTIMSFQSIAKNREVSTERINETLVNLGHQMALPLVKKEEHQLAAYLHDPHIPLIESPLGIAEPDPKKHQEISPQDIDWVIIPLLAFDEIGNRVGYGKGYYDRFLPLCRPDVLKIGLCLDEPFTQIQEVDEHDVPLDLCISPIAIHYFDGFYQKNPFDSEFKP